MILNSNQLQQSAVRWLGNKQRYRAFVAFLMAWILLGFWYVEAEDFGDGRVAGEYVLSHDGISQHLILKPDHTFQEEDLVTGTINRASGTWKLINRTGHVAFSSNFIDARDASRGQDEREVYGLFKNYFGLVSITFTSDTDSVKAYKKLFS